MQHQRVRAGLLVSLGVLALTACDPIIINHRAVLEQRATSLAEAYCAVYQACDCEPLATDALHPDPSQCVAEQKTRLLAAFDQAEQYALDFDQGCMNELLSRYEQLGCEGIAGVQLEIGNPALGENFGCSLYHGDQTDGICERVAGTGWSDCAAGQMCGDDNRCGPKIGLVVSGQACVINHSEFSLDCAAGLYCHDQSATCEPFLALGEPCTANATAGRCAPDHYCSLISADSIEGTCQPLLAASAPCDPTTDMQCLGWCIVLEGSDDPTLGACVDIPAVCLHDDLQPPA